MALLHTLTTPLRALMTRMIAAWVRPRLIEPSPDDLGITAGQPVIYVLPRTAWSDAWLLGSLTSCHGLPGADRRYRLAGRLFPGCLALPLPRRRLRRLPRGEPPFEALIERLEADPELEIQLVPVSIFWGRAPGKRFGFWRLVAADSWQLTGRLRRLLAVLVNRRSVEVHFGAPLMLRDLCHGRESALTNRKVARLLRVHFRRIRTRVLGPDISHRRTLIEGMASSPGVGRAIDEQTGTGRQSRQRLKRRARRYGHEIASNMTYPVLRFMDGLLRRLWNRLYDGVDVRGLDVIKPLAEDHTLVYVPCHRSHVDYLLLSYVLYQEGLMPPHIAAGRNLDMPLIGPLLRRSGAFFLRRSFRDNRLYGAVFNEYLHRLIARGHPLEYFMEGGRSRSGRMLPARPGMLAMTLRSFLRSHAAGQGQPLAFVPVYIGYERVIESASYQRELRGGKKHKETPLALLRVLGKLRQPFGRVSLNIGEPLRLADYLDHELGTHWRQEQASQPAWFNSLVPRLGETLSRRINAAAALNPVNLVALVLLATPHHAIEERLLERQLSLLAALQRRTPGATRTSLTAGEPAEWITQALSLGMIQRRQHPLGDILLAAPHQAGQLGWYRNNVLHLFALAGLTAFAFRHQARHTLDDLETLLAPGWPILARELMVPTPPDLRQALAAMLEALVEEGLLERDAQGGWRRIDDCLEAGESIELLGQLMQPSLERGYLLLAVLIQAGSEGLTAEELAEHSRLLTERLAVLSGLDAPEFFDTRLFVSLVESLELEGWLWRNAADRLTFDGRLRDAARRSRRLFDPALRHRLQLITRRDD
ncbi:glycerol-3-phosphate 1-O-acyltransferase PlsB [Halomonas halodenitrificans]|uniref:glycerol-3-phosphate 1-O-acyltransferase PlsB n=1 Tax=Halomonas halodenitrificans TaxID=28252 RepID=UPI0005BE60C0|nr:glycerol-3-phosphate 1-O-acyltransferase PlsB [Halomonas halodenitrificans]